MFSITVLNLTPHTFLHTLFALNMIPCSRIKPNLRFTGFNTNRKYWFIWWSIQNWTWRSTTTTYHSRSQGDNNPNPNSFSSFIPHSAGYSGYRQSVGYSGYRQSVGYSGYRQSVGYSGYRQSAGYSGYRQSVLNLMISKNLTRFSFYLALIQLFHVLRNKFWNFIISPSGFNLNILLFILNKIYLQKYFCNVTVAIFELKMF